ncbi:MAG: hypothetical protein KJ630_21420 [Proteobacteria bacterium]|nr:hypothetical protein [Pseudomonadota bacterium]
MTNVLVIIVTSILIAGLFVYLSWHKKQKLALFTEAVLAAGWRIELIEEPLVSGVLVSGRASQGEWFFETKATASPREAGPGSSETGHFTRWWTSSISLPGRNLLIGPRPPGYQVMGMLNGPLLQMAIKTLLGKDADWVGGLSPVETSDPVVNERILCLANSGQDVHRLLKPDATRHLLLLPEKIKPVIKLRAAGLEIVLPDMQLDKIEDVQALVELGLNLADSWLENKPN